MIFSKNRYPLFRIMLWPIARDHRIGHPAMGPPREGLDVPVIAASWDRPPQN
jgi:hypothetical protein